MIRSRSTLFICAVLFLGIGFVQSNTVAAESSPAEKLVTVLPDDTLGFVTTSGGDSLKPAFEKTILGRIWNDPGVQTFYQSIKKELLAKAKQEMPDANDTKIFDTAESFIRQVLARPFVIGAARKDAAQSPPIYGFVIFDAGPRKAEIAAGLAKLESLADEGDIVEIEVGSVKMHGPKDTNDVPGYWGWVGNYLVFAINDGNGLAMKYLQGKARPALPSLQNIPGTGDALAVSLDREKIFNFLRTLTKSEGDEEKFSTIETVIKELGFDKLTILTARVDFDGPDIVINTLLEIQQPRTGILTHLKSINLEMFDMVDAGAMSALALNCDMEAIYDTVMKAISAAEGEDFAEIEKAMAEMETEVKFKRSQEPLEGLLESLSGEMVFYVLPSGAVMHPLQKSYIVVAKLKNAKLWEETMVALEKYAMEKSDGMVQISSQVQEERTVHTWGIMPLAAMQTMPSWTLLGDKVVIASNPTMLKSVVDQIDSGTQSIRTTEGFKKATAKLPNNVIFIRYSDTKAQFNQLMMVLQQFWPMATMFAAKAGLTLPFVLPNLSHIAEDMSSSCEYWWFDSEGLRSHYRGAGIEPSLDAGAGSAVGIGILMTTLARTRQHTFRKVSATHLKGIGRALQVYANDYDDQFPPNLQELIEKCDLTPEILESKRKPKDFEGPSYIYIAGQNTSMDPGNILVYENPAFCHDGLNVLYMDCHVAWTEPDEFLRELKATYQRLGREMPEIKFMD